MKTQNGRQKSTKNLISLLGMSYLRRQDARETFGLILNKIDNASQEICNNVNYRLKMQHKLKDGPWRPAYNIDYLSLSKDCKKSELKSSIN